MSSDPLASWLPTLVAPVFFSSGVTIRIISGIFITLGIAFVAPIVALIAFDIGLWLWRLYSLSRNAFLRRQRLLREQQRERRQQMQMQQQLLQKKRRELKGAASSTATPTPNTTRRQ